MNITKFCHYCINNNCCSVVSYYAVILFCKEIPKLFSKLFLIKDTILK